MLGSVLYNMYTQTDRHPVLQDMIRLSTCWRARTWPSRERRNERSAGAAPSLGRLRVVAPIERGEKPAKACTLLLLRGLYPRNDWPSSARKLSLGPRKIHLRGKNGDNEASSRSFVLSLSPSPALSSGARAGEAEAHAQDEGQGRRQGYLLRWDSLKRCAFSQGLFHWRSLTRVMVLMSTISCVSTHGKLKWRPSWTGERRVIGRADEGAFFLLAAILSAAP